MSEIEELFKRVLLPRVEVTIRIGQTLDSFFADARKIAKKIDNKEELDTSSFHNSLPSWEMLTNKLTQKRFNVLMFIRDHQNLRREVLEHQIVESFSSTFEEVRDDLKNLEDLYLIFDDGDVIRITAAEFTIHVKI